MSELKAIYKKKVNKSGSPYDCIEVVVVKDGKEYPINQEYVNPSLALTLDTLGIKQVEQL